MTKAFEVRVRGELGEPMLRRLGWAHSTVSGQTLMRVEATPGDLEQLLRTCSERGLTIERVVRIGPVPAPPTDS